MKFSDLHLCVPLGDVEQARRMVAKSFELGYSRVGVPFSPNTKPSLIDGLRRVCGEFGLDFVTRLELAPKSSNELLGSLRRFRREFEVVSVLCGSKPVARQAAKDRRVDLLCFRALEPRKRFFDRAEAELASKSSAALEIDIAMVLGVEGFARVSFLSCLRREVAAARRFGVPVVISSGATEPLLLRKPYDSASLGLLFEMDLSVALEALSANPAGIVERNRAKLSPGYVALGVRIVRRGKGVD